MKISKLFSSTAISRALFTLMLALAGISVQAQPDGAELYANNCAACHKIDQDLVGPALKGISERRDEAWLLKWIKNSQAVIASGDQYAVDLFAKWNKVAMPAYDWSDEEVKSVLAYIKEQEKVVSAGPQVAGGDPAAPATPQDGGFSNNILLMLMVAVLGATLLVAGRTISAAYRAKGVQLFNWNSINAFLFVVFMVVFFLFVGWQFLKYMKFTLPEAASAHGVLIDQMLAITFWITFFVFIVTHILLFVYAYIYRRRDGRKAYFYADNHQLEFLWTIIPAAVLTVLVLYGTKVWREITQGEIEPEATTIELFAYQFGWKARYAGTDGELGNHNYKLISATNDMGIDPEDPKAGDDLLVPEVYLVVNKPVLLKMRARDVIHSAYLPHFRVQMNVVPGMPTQFYFTPTMTTEQMRRSTGNWDFNYELACNKICGAAHFNMRMKFVVVEQAEYDAWLAKQKYYFKKPEVQTASLN
jgi:cytochrome c oxidase subunit 2